MPRKATAGRTIDHAPRGIRSGSKLIESRDMAQATPELLARLRLTAYRRWPNASGGAGCEIGTHVLAWARRYRTQYEPPAPAAIPRRHSQIVPVAAIATGSRI